MPTIRFLPQGVAFEVEENTKLLVAANRNRIPIRFGCASCRCGTCGVKVEAARGALSDMKDPEKQLLSRMGLATDGTVRLACQTRLMKDKVTVDLDFQNTYSPDDGEDDEEDEDGEEGVEGEDE
jgi:ferredoxin